MNVMFVARGIPTSRYPLNGIFEFSQAKALAEMGINVTFVAIDLRSIRRIRRFGLNHGVKNGVEWYELSIPLGRFSLKYRCKIGCCALSFLFKFIYKNKQKPNIIHAHFAEFGYIASKLSLKCGVPLVITEHSSKMSSEKNEDDYVKYAIEAYRIADQRISVSRKLADNIKEKTGYSSVIVHNMVDLETFFNKTPCIHTGIRFVTVGNLVEIKRHNVLIEAFERIHNRYKNTHLEIIGEGPLHRFLLAKIREKSLFNHVKMHGYQSHEQIAEIFRSCDCFVFPSKSETFGVACIEAMASGLPVITTACGGPEDYVTNLVGEIVPVDDIKALARAMDKFIRYKNRYNRVLIREYAIKNFSPSVVAKNIINVYHDVLK